MKRAASVPREPEPRCLCGAEAIVLFPETDDTPPRTQRQLFPPRAIVAVDTFAVLKPTPGFGLCLEHAHARGWPECIPHERAKQTRGTSAAGMGAPL